MTRIEGGWTPRRIRRRAERAVLSALKRPPYCRKGLPFADVYVTAFQNVKSHPQRSRIMRLVKRRKWYTHASRPWKVSRKLEILQLIP